MATKYFSSHRDIVIAAVFLIFNLDSNLVSGQILAQSESRTNRFQLNSNTEAIAKHDNLETELEFYPLNIIVPSDPVFKNEAMFDYHKFSANEKTI